MFEYTYFQKKRKKFYTPHLESWRNYEIDQFTLRKRSLMIDSAFTGPEFLKIQTIDHVLNKFPERLLPYWQQPTTWLYPESDESTPHLSPQDPC